MSAPRSSFSAVPEHFQSSCFVRCIWLGFIEVFEGALSERISLGTVVRVRLQGNFRAVSERVQLHRLRGIISKRFNSKFQHSFAAILPQHFDRIFPLVKQRFRKSSSGGLPSKTKLNRKDKYQAKWMFNASKGSSIKCRMRSAPRELLGHARSSTSETDGCTVPFNYRLWCICLSACRLFYHSRVNHWNASVIGKSFIGFVTYLVIESSVTWLQLTFQTLPLINVARCGFIWIANVSWRQLRLLSTANWNEASSISENIAESQVASSGTLLSAVIPVVFWSLRAKINVKINAKIDAKINTN